MSNEICIQFDTWKSCGKKFQFQRENYFYCCKWCGFFAFDFRFSYGEFKVFNQHMQPRKLEQFYLIRFTDKLNHTQFSVLLFHGFVVVLSSCTFFCRFLVYCLSTVSNLFLRVMHIFSVNLLSKNHHSSARKV